MTLTDVIVLAMHGRGIMRIADVYVRVEKEAKKAGWPLNPAWQASVRKQMQKNCKTCPAFDGRDLFIKHQKAIWECRK